MQADGDGLLLNWARMELVLSAVRDPELAEKARAFAARGVALASFAAGDRTLADPERFERVLRAIVSAVALEREA
ncbi:hypothetical protein [Mycolicibacterium arenosum]|uniref:TetR family transcriptional regulator n=1 Tax=Mycolicibacterium arenosum TaxID=2952157 RepID=A0ABT1M389_9MYCO|nr:hypothetical protein [Mycolicibacterium sp. CAU 1645]MCP9273618.1 hypothetical protein [Mycolicibacterium sp. CAU 1645]